MNDLLRMTDRQNEALRARLEQVMAEKEQFVRLTALLVNALRAGGCTMVGKDPAFTRAEYESVPTRWTVSTVGAKAKRPDAKPEDPPEEFLVVVVGDAGERKRVQPVGAGGIVLPT